MKIKHFDPITEKWVVDGASNASNLELTNPGFLTDQGESISIDEAFTKVDNKLNKLEQNLAWVYKNGAIGGGGGGGGTGTDYTITVHDGDTIYTSTTSAVLNFTINSAGIRKSFTIEIRDSNNKVVLTTKDYSMYTTKVTLTNLTGTATYSIQAFDNNNQYTNQVFFKVVAGAISIEFDKNKVPATISLGGINEVPLQFSVKKNVKGTAVFTLSCNNKIYKTYDITTSLRDIREDARYILFSSGLFTPTVGQKFTFTAKAEATLNDVLLTSNVVSFSITIADSNSLIIVTENISEFSDNVVYDDVTKFGQGAPLSFNYYFSLGNPNYKIFNMGYNIYLMDAQTEVRLLKTGEVQNIDKTNNNLIFTISTVDLPVTNGTNYLKIVLFGYSVDAPDNTNLQYTKSVTAKITDRVTKDLYANNDTHNLLAYFSNVTNFPNSPTGTWNYKFSTDVTNPFVYEGVFASKFPNGVNLKLSKVNGVTNGFIISDTINKIQSTRLTGQAHGELEVADIMFPNVEISSGVSFFQQAGFNLSITYKADSSTDPEERILSIAKYNEDGTIKTGYEITLESVVCKIGNADMLICKLPQNELLTVDLDVSYTQNIGWYFKIFVNGIMSAVTKVNEVDIDWMFGSNIYFNCKNTNGVLSNYSNINIYDFKVYTRSQSELAIVQNYMSATEQALLKLGVVDKELDINLRAKNLFNSAGDCIIWDKSKNNGKGDFLEGNELYNKLIAQMKENMTPYPVVLIEETSTSPTMFEIYNAAVFAASQKDKIMGETFPCTITYTDTNNREVVIKTPDGSGGSPAVSSDKGVRIGLQGTSSLSYNAKNFELYMGDMDETGKDLLFQVKDEWLPENEFTLKADVMDSAHVNNVIIGEIINGLVTDQDGQKIKPFGVTPPMRLGNDVWGGDQTKADYIRSRFKHTSEGFPCLVFITFAPDADGNKKQKKFMGIYNFNLGRYAYYNLGLKLLIDYEKKTVDGPSIISSYTEKSDYWNSGNSAGVYSMEINQNNSSQGAFQQDDDKIIRFMSDPKYTSRDANYAYSNVKKFYKQMAEMTLNDQQKYTMDDLGQTPTKPIPGEFYKYNTAVYNFGESDKYLNWNNAIAYHLIGIIFGMVDSMCKNLTLRNWGQDVQGNTEWYTCFYDMDTAFGLNNAGQDIVGYYAHLHRWYNINDPSSGLTTYTRESNYQSSSAQQQYYASFWNRIWEVLENLPVRDVGGVGSRVSLESMYVNFRKNLFPDPEQFINKYYKAYTEKTGSIVFNYDYKIKYLKITQTYNESTGQLEDSTDFSQLKFLHGNRVIHVKDWFKKRIYFLDGVYGLTKENAIPENIYSPLNYPWKDNKATVGTKFGTTISASSRVLHKYGQDKLELAFWLSESDQTVTVAPPGGETIVYMYGNRFITKYDKLKSFPWTDLTTIDLPLLKELDLSDLATVPSSAFFKGGVYNPAGNNGLGVGLKSIQKLILKNVKLTGDLSAYNLDLVNCSKLQSLNISSSNITNVTLPSSASLKDYDLSNTNIVTLDLQNQTFLETLNISGCNKLTTIKLTNCISLKTINVPASVTNIEIVGCDSFDTLTIPYVSVNNSISSLTNILINNCIGLKNVNISGQNNPNLVINLVGAKNLEVLNLSSVKSTNIILPPLKAGGVDNFTSLKSINISKTDYGSLPFQDLTPTYLDLKYFPNLDDIHAESCKNLIKVECKNDNTNPINLLSSAFKDCINLTRVIGHYNLTGQETFKGCSKLIINDQPIYDKYGVNTFLNDVDVTNISIESTNLTGCFESCSSIGYDDFRFLMLRLTNNVTTIERMFKGCLEVSGALWYDMFRKLSSLTIMKDAFSGTGLNGIFYSRTSDYSYADDSTWGILDFLPKLKDAESAFSGTLIEWIDNNVFAPRLVNGVLTYSPIVNVTNMFAYCMNLKTCANTRATNIVSGKLSSETFFINLRNLLEIYPKGIFLGCQKIDMTIDEDSNGNTLLFHVLNKPNKPQLLTNSLYSGINLYGEVKVNVFGGITDTVKDGTYFIPDITSIDSPFSNSNLTNNATINLSQMGDIFKRNAPNLIQLISVFKNLKLTGTKSIPDTILKSCSKLINITELFSNLDIDNGGAIYSFPPQGMFNDCTNLQIVKGLLKNTNSVKIKLVGEGFKTCKLTDVSEMFMNSGIFGTLPYRLFFMNTDTSINKTINSMNNIFQGCYLLGYDSSRKLIVNEDVGGGLMVTWANHIVQTEGNKVEFTLDQSNMQKVPNFNNDQNFSNLAFDEWYLDGRGMVNAGSTDIDFIEFKNVMTPKYLQSDIDQAAVITANTQTAGTYKDVVFQHYMIPTDLFRYCSDNCNLSGILSNLTWNQNVVEFDTASSSYIIKQTDKIEGMTGRIPMKLLSSLPNKTSFKELFRYSNFEPFIGYNGLTKKRGVMYPKDLFELNTALKDVTSCFEGTIIPVGVDINSGLFTNNVNLEKIDAAWSNCGFDNRDYNGIGVGTKNSQFDFVNIFINKNKIKSAAGLFQVTITDPLKKGLLIITSDLLKTSYNINTIERMFLNCSSLTGAVPTFSSATYQLLLDSGVTNYLKGVTKTKITNADALETRLKPEEWLA